MRAVWFIATALQVAPLPSAAQQTAERPRYSLSMSQVYPGVVERSILSSDAPYPLAKRYEAFTPAEKAHLRSYYVDMPETDDPPFPVSGMRQIIADLALVAKEFQTEGELTVFVKVDAKGEAIGVKLIQYPNVEIGKVAAFILMRTRYKPASCGGVPCALEFPFRFTLELR